MKNSISIFVLIFVIQAISSSLVGQNANYNKGVSFKTVFMDYQSQNGGSITEFRAYHHGFEMAYHHRINNKVKLVIPASIGQVSSHVDLNCFHKTVYGLDGQVNYEFTERDSGLSPYILGGISGVYEQGGEFNLQAPIGFGLNFRVAKNAFWNFQSDYRFSFAAERNNLHHSTGFIYLWDGEEPEENTDEAMNEDSDKDGIMNELDLCPGSPGPQELKGCPDKDGDMIADYEDKCIDTPGLKELKGCPDTDGDGIGDNMDECPEVAGPTDNNGCPQTGDTDGDGIPDNIDKCPNIKGNLIGEGCPAYDQDLDGVVDSEDNCPTQYGLAIYNGCPDTDGDGIDDSRDRCPNSFGTVATNGCPEIEESDRQVLELAMRAVQFDTGKARLKTDSHDVLNQIGRIMNKYPDYNLSINGYSDNVGNATANQRLSEKRAKSCYEYLITIGVEGRRMNYIGNGESNPISDNNTIRGRALNRRTEFTLIPR